MTWITPLDILPVGGQDLVGGKGMAIARLHAHRLPVPRSLCITTTAYNDFLDTAGLREKIHLELSRKVFTEMRWEEVWDTSQRIRLMFLRSPMSAEMEKELTQWIGDAFGGDAVVARSSAPDEDRGGQSFAGLHASYTHLHGVADILRHVRLVWASLWSDAALLYRQELGLNTASSAMAVVVQEMVRGGVSGILFTQDPTDASRAVIEAVHGMNPPLVDGKIAPDRWLLAAGSGDVLQHTAPESRDEWQPPGENGTDGQLCPLPPALALQPPLDDAQVAQLWDMGKTVSDMAGRPQDIEWTYRDGNVVLLQARPITTAAEPGEGDKRAWYLSLHRSLDNLVDLQARIEGALIPEMRRVAEDLAEIDPAALSDDDLAKEIQRRWDINQQWVSVYWDDFIPFAHGMRLFGQVYNEVMAPEDPYAFMALLKDQNLISIQRNRTLADLADAIRDRPDRLRALEGGDWGGLDDAFRDRLDDFVWRFGDLSCPVTGAVDCAPDAGTLANILLEMAKLPPASAEGAESIVSMEAAFFASCPPGELENCRRLLPLARASYRLRDDDNIILGAIEARLISAAQEGRRRAKGGSVVLADVLKTLGLDVEDTETPKTPNAAPPRLRERQITGQPAGPGLARGTARIIHRHTDIARFKKGEVIVCDAVDPNMTFVMPLAAAIIERRGGMLIHGAIIAREYGLPCVTGVAGATARIQTGERVTVDGYLGIVTIGESQVEG
jgi:phosphoenolpyruvate synthase/pyruvate phosphate dikinase